MPSSVATWRTPPVDVGRRCGRGQASRARRIVFSPFTSISTSPRGPEGPVRPAIRSKGICRTPPPPDSNIQSSFPESAAAAPSGPSATSSAEIRAPPPRSRAERTSLLAPDSLSSHFPASGRPPRFASKMRSGLPAPPRPPSDGGRSPSCLRPLRSRCSLAPATCGWWRRCPSSMPGNSERLKSLKPSRGGARLAEPGPSKPPPRSGSSKSGGNRPPPPLDESMRCSSCPGLRE
mmetsp:Transcript_39602/g.105330  ORF Transcript_39602/g.105330 Transcript_39602/m.105330 type:complete len:234 (-) Transcript_39602:292-993(-)